jgi:hypothetical protein
MRGGARRVRSRRRRPHTLEVTETRFRTPDLAAQANQPELTPRTALSISVRIVRTAESRKEPDHLGDFLARRSRIGRSIRGGSTMHRYRDVRHHPRGPQTTARAGHPGHAPAPTRRTAHVSRTGRWSLTPICARAIVGPRMQSFDRGSRGGDRWRDHSGREEHVLSSAENRAT